MAEVKRIGTIAAVQRAYGGVDQPKLAFWALSPLAEGSDRLFAKCALDLGFLLRCPLPFPRDVYEEDFVSEESRTEFADLLGSARDVIEIDGDRGDFQSQSYEAAGRFVVRNCDLMIAIWDGKDSRGKGGTAEIVQFTISRGPPVIWIHAEHDAEPSILLDDIDLFDRQSHIRYFSSALSDYLARLLAPPAHQAEHYPSLIGRSARLFRSEKSSKHNYFNEPPKPMMVSKAHAQMMRIFGGRPAQGRRDVKSADQKNAVISYWQTHHKAASRHAGPYAALYRSAYVWIFVLAALSVLSASFADLFAHTALVKGTFFCLELLFLLLILCTVIGSERGDWHEKSIQLRLFAELCRKQEHLGPLGWTISKRPNRVKSGGTRSSPPDSWADWWFAAVERNAPSCGDLNKAVADSAKSAAVTELVEEQVDYHKGRLQQFETASRRFGVSGECLYVASLILVFLELLAVFYEKHEAEAALAFFAALLPALSAAFIGIRSYAELPLIAAQSARMHDVMLNAKDKLERASVARPLATQRIAQQVYSLSTAMLQDVEGWAELLGAKALEPG